MAQYKDQDCLVRTLAILQTLGYVSPTATPSNKDGRLIDTSKNLRLLDVIATGLSTGTPGDVVAAAFVERAFYIRKNGRFDGEANTFILLAKNTIPSIEDKRAATKLFDAINDPKTLDEGHLFPVLLKRCKENMKKRVRSLLDLLRNDSFQDLMQDELTNYRPQLVARSNQFDVNKEFNDPSAIVVALVEKYGPNDFKALWDALIRLIETNGRTFLDALEGMETLQEAYEINSLTGYDIHNSAFLNKCLLSDNARDQHKQQALKFKRRLAKIQIYTHAVEYFLQQVAKQRMRPIKYFWVEDEPSGTEVTYGPFSPQLQDEFQGVLQRLGLTPGVKAMLNNKLFASNSSKASELQERWKNLTISGKGESKTFQAYFHCELRIMHCMEGIGVSSGSIETEPASNETNKQSRGNKRQNVAVGVSKRSCLMCKWTLEQHNKSNPNRYYVTSGDHGKAYARWFNLHTIYTRNVLLAVEYYIRDAVIGGRKKRVVSDEYFSSSGDERRLEKAGCRRITNKRIVEKAVQRLD